MPTDVNKKVNQIREFFKKNQPNNHPIKNHPLSKCEELVKNLYFDMLCVSAQYENEDVENQNKFIQRIMAGCNEQMPINEHIKRAMSLTVENVTEFIKQCKDNKLEHIFLIDIMIITCGNGTPNKKQVDFVAELADALGVNKEQTIFLSKLSNGILEQNFEKVKSAFRENCIANIEEKACCYLNPIKAVNIINNDKKQYFYSYSLKDISIKKALGLDGKTNNITFEHKDEIVFENQYIDIAMKFDCVKKVKFIGCKFEFGNTYLGYEQTCLSFSGVSEVEMDNCNVVKSNLYVFDFGHDCNVKIANSSFNDVARSLIYSENSNNIIIENCEFQNVLKNGRPAISSNNYCTVKNCRFENCSNFCLFDGRNCKFENNILINSGRELY